MKRYKLFLMFCMAGLCLISFLHFFKTLSYVTFPRELASLSPNLVSSFFWNNAPVTPQASPEPGSPDLLRTPLYPFVLERVRNPGPCRFFFFLPM